MLLRSTADCDILDFMGKIQLGKTHDHLRGATTVWSGCRSTHLLRLFPNSLRNVGQPYSPTVYWKELMYVR